ncbi:MULTISPECIES: acyltransferase family protein [Chitinophagaceae]
MEKTKERFLALDIFRGMTICFMIIVNTSGNGDTTFAPLKHADWFGFTPTDLVFPSFLFAVGNAQSFATSKWGQMSSSVVLGKIFKRTAIMFLLGYLMYWFPFFQVGNGSWTLSPISHTRIFGVLQRIALTYCIASLMFYYLKEKTVLLISILLLLVYWWLLVAFGDLTLQGNAVYRLDTWLLGDDHLYHGEGVAFDPEGLLSTIPAIGNVVAGYFVGKYLQRSKKDLLAILKVAIAGFLLICIAFMWNYVFPISKKLWTSPFTLLTVGLDCLMLVTIIYLVDLKHYTGKWVDFFVIPGKNPLAIYLFSELFVTVLSMITMSDGDTFFHWLFVHFFSLLTPYWGAFVQAIVYMLVCWSLGWWMNKKNIYVRI